MMKKVTLFLLALILFAPGQSLLAQNSEIPKNTKPSRPQNGGAEGGDGSMSGRNRPQVQTPVYRPRIIQPVPMFYPVPMNAPQNSGQTYSGVTGEEAKQMLAARKRAAAEVELKKALFEMRAPVQAFDIKDVSKPFAIEGTKGFKVTFPELAFVDSDGNPVLGEVEIRLREFTDFSEFAEANLTTQTTDGELLETGGMINLEAMSGEKQLQLAQGKNINITVPNAAKNKDFTTFYGSGTDRVLWSLQPTANSSEQKEAEFDGYTIKMIPVTMNLNGKDVTLQLFKNWKPLSDYVNENLKVPADVRNEIKKDGIPFMYTIETNMMGRIKSVTPKYPEYSKNTLISGIQSKIKTILLEAPALAVSEGNVDAGKKYDIMFVTAKNYLRPLPLPVNISAPLNQSGVSERVANANPDSKNVDEFVMQSSQLSKINCDRFSGSNSKDTQTFNFERADAKVYVVFKDQRSMLQPAGANGHYLLTKVPTGSNVRYVAVVYGDDGSVKMGVKDTETKTETVDFGPLTDFNAEALKKALNE